MPYAFFENQAKGLKSPDDNFIDDGGRMPKQLCLMDTNDTCKLCRILKQDFMWPLPQLYITIDIT